MIMLVRSAEAVLQAPMRDFNPTILDLFVMLERRQIWRIDYCKADYFHVLR